ncbi:MAG TPA: sulfite exporter TauE/SafE family protein [Candidatus Deferrimicrobium sp.]|nr:sulfite exporter TauE/SafE family protein [Candidatus Deferrimicrobium sp.]
MENVYFHNLLLIGMGVIVGFLSGMFGVGGSSIATPLLRLIDIPRMIALASPLPVSFPTALIGGIVYWRRGLVHTKAVFWTIVGGAPAVVVGAYLTTEIPGRALMALTGIFVIAVGLRLLLKNFTDATRAASSLNERTAWSFFVLVGIIIGIFSGLLGNGGGFLLLPAYMLLFRFPPREAAATSLVAVALLALPGTFVHYTLGHIDFKITALMSLGVIPSTYLGAHLGLSLSKDKARLLFGLFLLLFGLFFLIRTICRAEMYGWLS